MLTQEKCNAIWTLRQEGMPIHELSKNCRVSRNTVRGVIKRKGQMPTVARKDKIEIDSELLRTLYMRCNGWVERIHEVLADENGITIPYSTLTRKIRDCGLGKTPTQRCSRVPDEPGAEMQHDTSPYTLPIGGQDVKVVASLIYLRYSKMRYLKFYRSFNRFQMKCFFHAALNFWGVCAP